MSRRRRPLSVYRNAAKKLGGPFAKYQFEETLSPQVKAHISRAAKLPPVPQRTDEEYIKSAISLSKFAPGLKKYKRRNVKKKPLNSGEKSAIVHRENQLRFVSASLIPLPRKADQKKFKDMIYAPGIMAIPMRGAGENATITRIKKEMILVSNGRKHLLWRLNDPQHDPDIKKVNERAMKKAGETVFSTSFDIEKLIALAKKAFALKPIRIRLWSEHGIVGEAHKTLEEWTQWLYEDYSQYQNVERWVNGIAIHIA